MKALIVIDMQEDFIRGTLPADGAASILPYVKNIITTFEGCIYYTLDTHDENYLSTKEGQHLPIPHCLKHTKGWQIDESLLSALQHKGAIPLEKQYFSSLKLTQTLLTKHQTTPFSEIHLMGICTDICVIANAFVIQAHLPEVTIYIHAQGCAGTTKESHENALKQMELCQMCIV